MRNVDKQRFCLTKNIDFINDTVYNNYIELRKEDKMEDIKNALITIATTLIVNNLLNWKQRKLDNQYKELQIKELEQKLNDKEGE